MITDNEELFQTCARDDLHPAFGGSLQYDEEPWMQMKQVNELISEQAHQ